jgi:hypothetical protein
MKRVEVQLGLPVVAPLLDIIKRTVDDLHGGLAAPQSLQDLDEELGTAWKNELLEGQNDDCRRFMALFDSEFFASGMVAFDDDNAESVLRACVCGSGICGRCPTTPSKAQGSRLANSTMPPRRSICAMSSWRRSRS